MSIKIKIPLSDWLVAAFHQEIENSYSLESERIAAEESEKHGDEGLDADEIERLFRDLVCEDEIIHAAEPDYAEGFVRECSVRAGFQLNLEPTGKAKNVLSRAIKRSVAVRLVGRDFSGRNDLASAVEALFEEWLEEEAFKSGILEYVAESTDALVCDRLLNARQFEKRARSMRKKKRA